MTEINSAHDLIDSRDLQEAIEELESLIEDGDATDDDRETLATLTDFANQFRDYAPDYEYGETAIRDSYFQEYAQDLAEDIGAVNHDATWPNNCIDWEQAARELKMDYTAIEFDGITYWVR